MWLVMAVLSAFFAGITAILAKCAIRKTDSDIATVIRTAVVLIFSLFLVLLGGSFREIHEIGFRSAFFLVLSGLATGASWLCYFKALSVGDVNKVVAVDKLSTTLSVLLAIFLFQETDHLPAKLIGTAVLTVGIFLMVEKKQSAVVNEKRQWIVYAVFSAGFAALTSVLAKIGIEKVNSNLATAIRTFVVLIMALVLVFAKGKQRKFRKIDKRELLFLVLSGLATGASWLCYFYAIQNGIVSVVVPIDKLSVVVTVAFSYFVFREKLTKKSFAGLCLMVAGILVIAIGK